MYNDIYLSNFSHVKIVELERSTRHVTGSLIRAKHWRLEFI